MKETKKDLKKKVTKVKYKARDTKKFKESYGEMKPYYKELSKGESVEVDMKDKTIISWINNKIIVKEN
tara:strand:- start:690 stop:893 length:204 start_codon:yes stop_codon:yes gene_type:complete